MEKFVLKSGTYWFSIVLAVGLLASGLLAIAAGVPVQKIEPNAVYMRPIAGLSPEDLKKFQEGEKIFRTSWLIFPSLKIANWEYMRPPAMFAWGLGPTFIANSCMACHVQAGHGKTIEQAGNTVFQQLLRISLPGEGPPPFNGEGRIPGAVEGETLKIAAKSAGDARPQDMSSFKAAQWSGSSHVWWTGARPGGRLVLEVPLEVRGRYEIVAVCSKAHDYATITLAWNGAKPTAPIDLYDKDAVTVTPEVSLGVFDLEPGTVPLTVDIVGENPAATKAWMFGLDYLRFVPVKAVEAKP